MKNKGVKLHDIRGLVEVTEWVNTSPIYLATTRNGFHINPHGVVANPDRVEIRPPAHLRIKTLELAVAEVSPRVWLTGYQWCRGNEGAASGCHAAHNRSLDIPRNGGQALIHLLLEVAHHLNATPSQLATGEFREWLHQIVSQDLSLPTLELTRSHRMRCP